MLGKAIPTTRPRVRWRSLNARRSVASMTIRYSSVLVAVLVSAAPLASQSLTRVSVGPGGVEGNDESYGISVTSDGRCVAFYSDASNLVARDHNATGDVFLRNRW